MTRFRALVAYDGTVYHGFQRQAGDIPTIQLMIEEALKDVTGQTITVIGAGRTDSGVHALGQVIAFDAAWTHEDAALLRAVNVQLPPDIALQVVTQQPGFHPRYDAQSRVYEYTILECPVRQPLLLRQTWQMTGPLDRERMQQAAMLLLGTHDFATFGQPPTGTITIRKLFASEWMEQVAPYGSHLTYHVEGTGFLKHMVRRMVAMMVRVGLGRLSVADFEAAFRQADISLAKQLAPPCGLVLKEVRYPDRIRKKHPDGDVGEEK